jgi:hypothetical protein
LYGLPFLSHSVGTTTASELDGSGSEAGGEEEKQRADHEKGKS